MKKTASILALIAALPFTGFAHEGHGHTHGFTITHYMVEPDHALFTGVVLLATIVYLWNRRRKAARP